MKKLIPALVLLLVSAMVLSTSSYAWFSMNRTVSATGMSLKSTAPANLLITNAAGKVGDTFEDDVWQSSIAATEQYAGKLFPSSSFNAIDFFAIASGQTIGDQNIGGVATTYEADSIKFQKPGDILALPVNNGTDDNLKTGYWAEYTLYLKTTGSANLTVYLSNINITTTYTYTSVTVPEGTDLTAYFTDTNGTRGTGTAGAGGAEVYTRLDNNLIDDCLRVAIFTVVAGVKTLVGVYDAGDVNDSVNPISVVSYTGDTYNGYTASGTDCAKIAARETTNPDKFASANGASSNTFTVTGSQAVTELLVKVWIEGQNTKCMNAVAGQNFTIGLTFNTVGVTE